MIESVDLPEQEAAGIAALATYLEASPSAVQRAIIRNALGYGYREGSLQHRVQDACNDMEEGILPGVVPDADAWSNRPDSTPHPLMPITEVAQRLRLSISMIRKRQRNPKDPLRRARSRLGKKRPIHFDRAKIIELERQLG